MIQAPNAKDIRGTPLYVKQDNEECLLPKSMTSWKKFKSAPSHFRWNTEDNSKNPSKCGNGESLGFLKCCHKIFNTFIRFQLLFTDRHYLQLSLINRKVSFGQILFPKLSFVV